MTVKIPAVEVFIDLGPGLCLTYIIPQKLKGQVGVGSRVLVPLSGRQVPGIVLEKLEVEPGPKTRAVISLIDPIALLNPGLVELARAISKYYLCSFPRALKSMIPAAVRKAKKAARVTWAVTTLEPSKLVKEISLVGVRAPRQAAILKELRGVKELPVPELLQRSGAGRSSLQALIKRGWVRVEERFRNPDTGQVVPSSPLKLTGEQQVAYDRIRDQSGKFGIFLLHGITGSGKTEIYLQAIADVLAKEKQAIVLVPEISLTPQTADRFRSRFGERVAVIHSALADGERARVWKKICQGKVDVVLGPRSAVFAPLPNLGIIVVDEEHVTTYKQYDSAPFYHARDVAILRARLSGIPVILGSATPSLESYHNAKHGSGELLVLKERPLEAILPQVKIVDMRREAERAGRPVNFSNQLMRGMFECLEAGGQCILFINRRGFNTAAVCQKCGYVARCRHCSVALTHHRRRGVLVCHLCGYTEKVPRLCALCKSPEISLRGLGTERVEDQISRCFPGVPLGRMDTDTVSKRGTHEKVLSSFRRGEIRILVGTQMIAKGLDFPGVTLVGVIFADTALNLADFRAAEYTFQILTQVSGRSGRGDREGEVIIQTYNPRHPALRAAAKQDYESFYASEIRTRDELGFPPVTRLISLTVSARNEAKSEAVAGYLARCLSEKLPEGVDLMGPAPPPVERVRGRFRWQVIIRGREVLPINRVLAAELKKLKLERGVKVEVDVDPVSML